MATAPSLFSLSSADIAPDSIIGSEFLFNGFGCTGPNISPALSWTGAPEHAKSFAITCYDPDAPSGSGWWHWMVYDMPPTVHAVPTGAGNAGASALPDGAKHGMTDYGVKAWGGPCPPAGDAPHRYVFTVFALGVDTLDVPVNATSALLGFNINANTIAKASFTARFGR